MPDRLDLTSLHRVGLGDRWRVVASSGRLLIGLVCGLLLVLVGGVAVVALVASGTVRDDTAFSVVVVVLALAGLYVVHDCVHQAGTGAALRSFARANGLELVEVVDQDEYAALPLRTGEHVVQHAVRLPAGSPVVELREIGDRFPVGGELPPDTARAPMAYLRVRFHGRVPRAPDLPPEVDEGLRTWAGDYELDLHLGELTVLGTTRLDAHAEGRVATGLALLDDLVGLVHVEPPRDGSAAPLARVAPEPVRRRSSVAVVAATLLTFVALVVGVTVIGSSVQDETLGNRPAAVLLVGTMIVVMMVVVGAVARWAVAPRRADPLARRSTRRDAS